MSLLGTDMCNKIRDTSTLAPWTNSELVVVKGTPLIVNGFQRAPGHLQLCLSRRRMAPPDFVWTTVYRKLNSVTDNNIYPLPLIDNTLQSYWAPSGLAPLTC